MSKILLLDWNVNKPDYCKPFLGKFKNGSIFKLQIYIEGTEEVLEFLDINLDLYADRFEFEFDHNISNIDKWIYVEDFQ